MTDITVYKIIMRKHGKLVTQYQEAEIVLGQTYKSELKRIHYKNVTISEITVGIHSYIFRGEAINDCIYWNERPYPSYSFYTVKCVIPKGSKYYVGDFMFGHMNSIASDTIIYGTELID